MQLGLRNSVGVTAKRLVNRWRPVKIFVLILLNLLWRLRLTFGLIGTKSGTAHEGLVLEESLDYIEEVFSDYKLYGKLDRFAGAVAEVGPGDNAGVACLMRRDGCEQVDLIDRYRSYADPEQQGKIYEALSERHNLAMLRQGTKWDGRALSGIVWRNGESAEEYFSRCAQENTPQMYDFVVSRAVLEHLDDPLLALEKMVTCLRPGGRLLHKVDLRDHGMFSQSHHELAWFEVSGGLLRMMTSHSGYPNRILMHHYRALLERLKREGLIDYSLLVTRLVEAGEIIPSQNLEEIDKQRRESALRFVETKRPRFAPELRSVAAEDLAVSGVFIVARRVS